MGHKGGKDLVSIKKLEQWEGLWHYHKEVLQFELDGSDHTIGILTTKANHNACNRFVCLALCNS
jgi:hypothetical protein